MNYRIINKDGLFITENRETLISGNGQKTWFTLEQARKIVNYDNGEMIVEHDGLNILWEVL